MGLDFSYMLYFRHTQIWDVLRGGIDIAQPHQPPAEICFPDHVLTVPLHTWGLPEQGIHCDDAEIRFALVLYVAEDKAILDYTSRYTKEYYLRSPPPDEKRRISVGYIYLTIYQSIPDQAQSDWVLFDFGTTGTRMSLLFDESTSIRDTFKELAQKCHSVCAVFNRESGGVVFWLNDHDVPDKRIDDPYILPEEIATLLGE